MIQPGAQRLIRSRLFLAIAPRQPRLAQFAQIAGGVVAGRHVELRQVVTLGAEVDVAHLGDEQAVVERAGDVAEEVGHFSAGLEVVAGVGEAHPARFVDGGSGLDAQQHVVGRGLFGRAVVDVVGSQEAQVVAGGHVLEQGLVNGRQFRDAMLL